MRNLALILLSLPLFVSCVQQAPETEDADFRPSTLVSTLVGTQSTYSLSTGNTYPAIAVPWGMNFYTPQTGENTSGWAYTYDAHQIRAFKQTHQPSPWINDYGVFSLMPVTTKAVSETERGSWFSHESEVATPYYYSVYLADHDVLTEITPTERAAVFRMTYPESETSALIVDAFQGGSSLEVLDGGKTIIGRSTYNNGGVPDNFANYFIITLDRAPKSYQLYDGDRMVTASSAEGAHMQLRLEFPTRKNETIEARVSSSFISSDQARRNILEVQDKTFDQVRDQAQAAWDDVLGRIRVQGGSTDQMRTFYSCLYRATLFPLFMETYT